MEKYLPTQAQVFEFQDMFYIRLQIRIKWRDINLKLEISLLVYC